MLEQLLFWNISGRMQNLVSPGINSLFYIQLFLFEKNHMKSSSIDLQQKTETIMVIHLCHSNRNIMKSHELYTWILHLRVIFFPSSQSKADIIFHSLLYISCIPFPFMKSMYQLQFVDYYTIMLLFFFLFLTISYNA